MSRKLIDFSGRTFGKLTVQKRAPNRKGNTMWTCLCECGKQTDVRPGSLTSGDTTSCGCVAASNAANRLRTHGMTNTPEFSAWYGAIQRCYVPTHKAFARYGGRGIRVCDRWRESFTNFHSDMGYRPSKYHSLDRKNNNGDYTPDNCRWATSFQQNRNKENTLKITFMGETLHPDEWGKRIGLKPSAVTARIKRGWSEERAITTPRIKNK